jgi:putative membrane protein
MILFSAQKNLLITLIVIFFAVLIWSVINPKTMLTWFLEVVPALVGFVALVFTYRQFPLTSLLYVLITLHAIILMIGGHYTYAEVPLFDWIRDTFGLSRNHYDRVGHFAQGFVPAMIVREVLIRTSPLKQGKWLFFVVVCICLSISAMYELIEWQYAVIAGGESADEFLGSQGDIWDTQSDMALALVASIIALISLSKLHDKMLNSSGLVEDENQN